MMTVEFDQAMLIDVFVSDAAEYVERAEQHAMKLEQSPGDSDAMASLFRDLHTLKGDAAIVGANDISEIAHGLEDYLDDVRSGIQRFDGVRANVVLSSLDVVKERMRDLVARARGEEPVLPGELDPTQDRSREHRAGNGGKGGQASTLRVDVTKLDRMLEILGEIAAGRAKVNKELAALGNEGRAILESQSASDRLHTDLHEVVLRLRMVPIEPVLRHYQRTVRDLADKQGKLVRFVVDAGDVEVDTSVVERLREPLTHLIRNAVDHGIERPHERLASGKSAMANITITAQHEMSHIVLNIIDDGRGVDHEKVRETAIRRGMLPEEHDCEEQDLLNLLFEPGFSTAVSVTDVSGRGVGMDAVRTSIQGIRGGVALASRKGEGMSVTLRIPLSLARGFAFDIEDAVYVVPLESVVECIKAPEQVSDVPRRRGVTSYRGEALPYIRLRSFFGISGVGEREDMLVVKHRGLRAGIVVDRLRGEAQTAAQPLHRMLDEAKGISGASILDDGSLALLLDVAEAIEVAGSADDGRGGENTNTRTTA